MPFLSILALLSLAAGFFLERQRRLSRPLMLTLSRSLINLFYPALIFSSLLLRFEWQDMRQLWQLPLLLFGLLLLGLIVGRVFRHVSGLQQPAQKRCFVFLAIMPNYSFVPLVVAQAFLGAEGIALVAVASLGADIFLWTLAFPEIAGSGRRSFRQLRSPPLLSLLAAVLAIYAKDLGTIPLAILEPLNLLGRLTLPASMLLLGCHLARARPHLGDQRAHLILLAWHLLLAPAVMLLFLWLWPLPYAASWTLLLIASMPSAIISVVLAEMHQAEPEFASLQIFAGHLAWLLSGPLWLWFGHLLFLPAV